MSVVYKFLFPAKPVGNAFSLFFVGVAYPFRSIAAFAWYPEMDEF